MTHDNNFDYYQKKANWDFSEFEIETECLTDWDLYSELRRSVNAESRVLDLGTGGGEKLLAYFPICGEVIGTDFSPEMIRTATENLKESGRKNISFKVMDNLHMDVPDEYFDVVVARHTIIDAKQIFTCLRTGGRILVRGVDKYDCWDLKMMMGSGQAYGDPVSVSITDYENIINAGFSDVELVPIYEREFFRDADQFKAFLRTVPILDVFDEELLDRYIAENTFDGRIRLQRRYYGITGTKAGKKP